MTDIEIFCDFDGTITKKDTINYFLETYADKKWLDIEKNWEDGLIGSNECMTRQLELLPDITEKAVETFIKDIKIDDDFLEFYSWVKSNEIPFYILSDGFDFFISAILRKYKIAEIEFYSNKLELKHGRFVPFYANPSGNCEIKSAMCKCEVFNKLRNVKNKSIYIGDGLSDICVSSKVDMLFAKNKLSLFCDKNNRKYIKFNTFREVIDNVRFKVIR